MCEQKEKKNGEEERGGSGESGDENLQWQMIHAKTVAAEGGRRRRI